MKMCNMRSYYMYKFKEKHDKMNMGLQLEQYRKSIIQYTVGSDNYFTKMAAISWLVEYMHREK